MESTVKKFGSLILVALLAFFIGSISGPRWAEAGTESLNAPKTAEESDAIIFTDDTVSTSVINLNRAAPMSLERDITGDDENAISMALELPAEVEAPVGALFVSGQPNYYGNSNGLVYPNLTFNPLWECVVITTFNGTIYNVNTGLVGRDNLEVVHLTPDTTRVCQTRIGQTLGGHLQIELDRSGDDGLFGVISVTHAADAEGRFDDEEHNPANGQTVDWETDNRNNRLYSELRFEPASRCVNISTWNATLLDVQTPTLSWGDAVSQTNLGGGNYLICQTGSAGGGTLGGYVQVILRRIDSGTFGVTSVTRNEAAEAALSPIQ